MTFHINQYFALMDQNRGGEKEWRNYVCNYVMRIAHRYPRKHTCFHGQAPCNRKTSMRQNVVLTIKHK